MTQQPDPRQQTNQQPGPDAQRGDAQPTVIAGATDDGRGYIVGPQGMAVENAPGTEAAAQAEPSVTDQVEEPAKVMRIGNMIRALLEEVRAAPLDESSRERLRETYASSIIELKEGLSEELADELERITKPFGPDHTPSTDELRIAKAQLVGWLEGLFSGIQTALVAQQMAARAQLEQIRRTALPGGPGQPGAAPQQQPNGTDGMYL